MKQELYNWFEAEWQASVKHAYWKRQLMYSTLPPPDLLQDPDLNWYNIQQQDVQVEMVKVEIAATDLIALIRELKDHRAHVEIQRRYPQLKEAYMNYLSQVYLTVDQMLD